MANGEHDIEACARLAAVAPYEVGNSRTTSSSPDHLGLEADDIIPRGTDAPADLEDLESGFVPHGPMLSASSRIRLDLPVGTDRRP